MMTNDIIRLEKQLLRHLSGFALKGSLMFMPPIRPVLRGIVFEGSSFDKTSFSATAFMLPLCVPTKHLYLNFGRRIRHSGGGDRWNMATLDLAAELGAALKFHAVPFLSRVISLLDFVEAAKTVSQANPNTRRAIAYALARAGRVRDAEEILTQLLDQIDTTIPWQCDLANEVTQLKRLLGAHPTEALRQLQAWERETEQNLELSEISGSKAQKN
jgi:hypothetical protein